ncbi:MAG: hypothetical protein AMXMBFR56_37600 [Polyangiaceae bacterium]
MKQVARVFLLACVLSACGSDDGGAQASGGAGGSAGDAGLGGTGGDAASDAPAGDSSVAKPEPADIGFQSASPVPSGEQLLFNDWNAQPNTVSSIEPDGSSETKLFEAYRVWSMGVTKDVSKIAFACGDPLQKEHYGVEIGDAIQHTWVFDVAAQSASVLAWGNINDECHDWNDKNDSMVVCRRRDFDASGGNKTYRIGRLATSGAFEWLGLGEDATPTTMELHPQVTSDESTLYYTLIQISGGKQARSIMKKTLPGGAPELVRASASSGVLSPDGTRLLFADTTQQSALFSMKLDGSDVVKVATRNGTSAVWSPDGNKVAYLWGETMGCSHIEVVSADGSQADAPLRIRDCGSSFVTELAWVVRP